MSDGAFNFEECLLKHYVRREAWLPACQKIKERLQQRKEKERRRLRYFTFCATGAIDVLMLQLEKVISKSSKGRLDTVFFFHRTEEDVYETIKRIPGAIGFPGDFIKVVLAGGADDGDVEDLLDSATSSENTLSTQSLQRLKATKLSFVQKFPFDVLNLDLEQFMFVARDQFPGQLVNALRKIFEWQRRPLKEAGRRDEPLEEFKLFFTTQIGPRNMDPQYRKLLKECLEQNILEAPELGAILFDRWQVANVEKLDGADFELFFKLAVPKVIARALDEQDWYIDSSEFGVRTYEFQRSHAGGEYSMLHMVFNVRRKNPPQHKRAPGEVVPHAVASYRSSVAELFVNPSLLVTEDRLEKTVLEQQLEEIFALREAVLKGTVM